MGALNKRLISGVKTITVLALLLTPVSQSLNLGLIAGDLKRQSSPVVIKKISKHSPVFINISGLTKSKTPFNIPKLPPKPPLLKILQPAKPSRKPPRSILSPLPELPLFPLLPILPPILPPLLPIVTKLPLLTLLPPLPFIHLPQLPILPPLTLLPKLKPPLKPLRVPIAKRSPLKTLKTDLKIAKVPPIKLDKNDGILKKLSDLKKKGSLTTTEYLKFKKLLLK